MRLKTVAAFTAVMAISLFASASTAMEGEEGTCWACDTDWGCCSDCWLAEFNKHETLGTWHFDGHSGPHGLACGSCGQHEGMGWGAQCSHNLQQELNTAIANDADVRQLLAVNSHLLRIELKSGKVAILDCSDPTNTFAEIQLTQRQTATLNEVGAGAGPE